MDLKAEFTILKLKLHLLILGNCNDYSFFGSKLNWLYILKFHRGHLGHRIELIIKFFNDFLFYYIVLSRLLYFFHGILIKTLGSVTISFLLGEIVVQVVLFEYLGYLVFTYSVSLVTVIQCIVFLMFGRII